MAQRKRAANPRYKGVKAATKPNGRKYRKPAKGNVFADKPRPRNGEVIITPGTDGSVSYKGKIADTTKTTKTKRVVSKAGVSNAKQHEIIARVVGYADLTE